jgi:diadenosine tetraphosphate (Ap4A) HIT family hydrolase
MPSTFTRIIAGDLPGRFVWKDELAVAFLTINPITPGHTLVVPRREVDHWIDLDPDTWGHCAEVARSVGRGIAHAFDAPRVGVAVTGFEVPHTHIHVLALRDLEDLDFSRADPDPDPADLDAAAERLREALRTLGLGEHVT